MSGLEKGPVQDHELVRFFGLRAVGRLTTRKMVDWALQCLDKDIDGTEVAILAGLSPDMPVTESWDWFLQTARSFGIEPPEKRDELDFYLKRTARAILEERCDYAEFLSIAASCAYTRPSASKYDLWRLYSLAETIDAESSIQPDTGNAYADSAVKSECEILLGLRERPPAPEPRKIDPIQASALRIDHVASRWPQILGAVILTALLGLKQCS